MILETRLKALLMELHDLRPSQADWLILEIHELADNIKKEEETKVVTSNRIELGMVDNG